MATNCVTTASLTWTPPSAAPNSGVANFSVTSSVNAQSVGKVDVLVTDASGTVIPIPFGTCNSPKTVIIKNMMSTDIGVRLNGAGSDTFKLGAGGMFMYSAPTSPGATPLSAISVVTTAQPAQVESVEYFVLGD